MRIGIDCRLWKESGVGRYTRNLVLNLLVLDAKNEYCLFVRSKDESEIRNQISEFRVQNSEFRIVPVNIPWHGASEQLVFPRIINKQNLDLMHFPYFSVPIFYNRPFVVTIHDLILHHFVSGEASTLPLWLYGFKMLAYRAVIHSAARKANRIIAVSQSTKDEIIDHLRIAPNKIDVIYEAANDLPTSPESASQGLTFQGYFLFVGNVYPHKNVETLIKAFKLVTKEKEVKLVFVGKEDFSYKRLKRRIKDLINSGRVVFVDNADDKTLASLYKNAICLIRPSHMEGFSLPPLEAIANKCLVIASDIPVHREIFGDSILYFNPRDYLDLKEKMEYVLSLNKNEKEKIVEKCLKRAKEFSWRKTAEQTLKIYESCV